MKTLKTEKGFTFIELAIAIAVVTIALFGFLAANYHMQKAGEVAFERAVSMQHANQVAERMRDLAKTSLSSVTSTYAGGATVASSEYTTTASESLPSEAVVVTYVNTSANPLDATITVNWQSKGVRTASSTLRTLLAKR